MNKTISRDFYSRLGITKKDVKGCQIVLDDRNYPDEKLIFVDKRIKTPKGLSEDEEIEFLLDKGRVVLSVDNVSRIVYNVLNSNIDKGQSLNFGYGYLTQIGLPMYVRGSVDPLSMNEDDLYEYPDGERDIRVFGIEVKSRIFPLIGENSYLRVQDEGIIRIQTSSVLGLSETYLGEGYSPGVGVANITAIITQI